MFTPTPVSRFDLHSLQVHNLFTIRCDTAPVER
jgi:hypothetical protein